MSMIAKNRIHSTWTPLSDADTNNKIFEERKNLVAKWTHSSTTHSIDRKHNPLSKSVKGGKKGPTPWRGSDPVPTDTWRYNYLNNDEVVVEVNRVRQKKAYGSTTADIIRNAKSKINTGPNVLNTMMRSQSMTRISSANGDSSERPKWARQGTTSSSSQFVHKNAMKQNGVLASITRPGPRISSANGDSSERPKWARQGTTSSSSQFVHKNAMKQNGVLASITRPGPVSPSPPRPASSHQSRVKMGAGEAKTSRPVTARSARDPPTTELFPQTPWKVPDGVDSDDEPAH
ncbi:F-box only protein 16-like isoform X1 [Elysia marginata]|uniref:F-box only protein 16-like isoform X1 n=1 Tax=Elysia marginata TaxID=1093978 RepID=A0AAV4I2V2_9GAST|nr:F-box only protein 16-like isoform X1 [Elysia marginata]